MVKAVYGRVWRKGSGKQGLECATVPVMRGKQAGSCCLKPALQPGIFQPQTVQPVILPPAVFTKQFNVAVVCVCWLGEEKLALCNITTCNLTACSLNSREVTFKQLRMNSPMKFNLYFTDLYPVIGDKYILPYSHPCCGH